MSDSKLNRSDLTMASEAMTQPGEDGEQNNQPLRLQVVDYRPSSEGWLLTVSVVRNGKQIFRDRVTVDSYKSRERFAHGVTAALIRETGYSGDLGVYFVLVSIWSEAAFMTEATILDEMGGGDLHSTALLLATPAGHA